MERIFKMLLLCIVLWSCSSTKYGHLTARYKPDKVKTQVNKVDSKIRISQSNAALNARTWSPPYPSIDTKHIELIQTSYDQLITISQNIESDSAHVEILKKQILATGTELKEPKKNTAITIVIIVIVLVVVFILLLVYWFLNALATAAWGNNTGCIVPLIAISSILVLLL